MASLVSGLLDRIRLLPVVMLAAGLLLVVKVEHIGSALADAHGAKAEKPEKGDKAPPPAISPEEIANAKLPERAVPPSVQRPPAAAGSEFSPAELEVLQTLAKRRAAQDAAAAQREQELALKANLLAAAESKVEGRIAELKKIEASIAALLKKYDEQEDKRLKGLVKVYENMKPKDAARIFEEMDGTLLLDMIERMKEQKVSAILGLMEPAKARKITQEIGTRRQLPPPKG